MGAKNQRAVYEWVIISDDLIYEWVRFFKGQVYEWGRFQNTGSHTLTKITPQVTPLPTPTPRETDKQYRPRSERGIGSGLHCLN